MEKILEFPDLLRLVDERSAAFSAAVTSAPDLGVTVPTCPEWTLLDLVRHLGGVQRETSKRAATLRSGSPRPSAKRRI
ncbi:maleylpyruvate isomerase N-terminal domain-containing protein [Streptomyces sp. XM83C]|uniref:maleylpyruvate isomerase N-terminal domain-containing protein n=1 Tax=Streptomyces sp. XM83C TaxID=2929781 RepID=UPI0035A8C8EF